MVKLQPSKLLSRVRFSLPAFIWAYSSAGLERTPDKREVDGSSPFRPINNIVIIREIINLDDGEVLKRLKRRPC